MATRLSVDAQLDRLVNTATKDLRRVFKQVIVLWSPETEEEWQQAIRAIRALYRSTLTDEDIRYMYAARFSTRGRRIMQKMRVVEQQAYKEGHAFAAKVLGEAL